GEGRADVVKVLRLGIRQRLQQHRVERAEDRGRGADAEREGGNRRQWKRRRATEAAEGEAKILEQRVHRPASLQWPAPERPGTGPMKMRVDAPADRVIQ